ncbi:type II toxin-antitoxin system HicB family antitoxin [Patescibacteria group bacterium]|nr:type II toxin-antitoxin system HicB family antitoxin [Patescibacteria group bacterium]
MKLRLQQFIENKLSKAHYEFDESVGQWAGWIEDVPGIYAQAKNIEMVRKELSEILEEWVLFGLRDNQKLKGFDLNAVLKQKVYA